jgi:predicted ATP-grasp superfamily ATP-dependent carboligase
MKAYNKYPPAVVLGAGINALGIIRSLGTRGIPILNMISRRTNHYSLKSKYIARLSFYSKEENLAESLIDLGKALGKKAVLYCSSDVQVLAVSSVKDILDEYYFIVLPERDVINQLMNKKLFYKFAIQNNFPVPRTYFSNNKEELLRISSSISYPCIVKPEYHDEYWDAHIMSRYGFKVFKINSKNELLDLCRRYEIAERSLILQEWIDGGDESVFFCLLYIGRDSNVLATFTGRKIRQYPVLTGSTSMAESLWAPDVAKISATVLTAAGCLGICSVELKYSPTTKNYYLVEPTVGRVDTQEAISTHSGIDIPYISYLDAVGEKVIAQSRFREGIKWINEEYDIHSVREYLRAGENNISGILSSLKGKRTYALFSLNDPKPYLAFIYGMGKALWRKYKW